MGFSFYLCLVVTLIGHASCDFRCICNYMGNLPVYSKASLQSRQLGVLDEYMCKFDAQSPLTDWFAIEYRRQVGYVQSNSGMVLKQNCPGSPPIEDAVTSVPVLPSRTMFKTAPSSSSTKQTTTMPTSAKRTLSSTSITTKTTTTTQSTTRTKTTSQTATIMQGDINLCHPDLVRWSKESPIHFLYQNKDKCFATSFDSGTFDETVLYCKRKGGKIITISNGSEEKFVEIFVMQTVKQPVWVGANTNTKDYKWTSNLGYYTNWASNGIPIQFRISAVDRNLYSCSVLDPRLGGKWRMTACTSLQRGICEFPISNTQHSLQSTPRNNVGAFISNLLAGFRKTTPAHNTHRNSSVFLNGRIPNLTTARPLMLVVSTGLHNLAKCPMELQTWVRSSPNHLLGQFDRSCYVLDKLVKTSFPIASGICSGLSGHLVDILGHREQEFLQDLLQHNGYKDKIWIGYTDYLVENTFFWTSEARSSYVHWAANEPSETVLNNRDCTLSNPRNHGLWETRPCEAQNAYICEFGTVR